jgi:hypothetical protein
MEPQEHKGSGMGAEFLFGSPASDEAGAVESIPAALNAVSERAPKITLSYCRKLRIDNPPASISNSAHVHTQPVFRPQRQNPD